MASNVSSQEICNNNDKSKKMEIFKNFPGMYNNLSDSDNDNVKGTCIKTTYHPNGNCTNTILTTTVNGKKVDISEIPELQALFANGIPGLDVSGIPELQNLQGLFGNSITGKSSKTSLKSKK
jgi:hypothetical protein